MTDKPDTAPAPKPGDLAFEPGPPSSLPETERASSSTPLPIPGEEPEVGLSQKGSDEDAIVRRETEI